jgi:hypothetical protein
MKEKKKKISDFDRESSSSSSSIYSPIFILFLQIPHKILKRHFLIRQKTMIIYQEPNLIRKFGSHTLEIIRTYFYDPLASNL